MLVSGTLPNRANAGFEPTPPRYAQIIADHILGFTPDALRPDEAYTVLEPCIGLGDLAAPIAALPHVRLYALEQDVERADRSRRRFPSATILTADLGTVKITPASFSLVLCNFPYGYDQLLGGRLEYQMLKQVSEALMPGGILVDIVPARSGWDHLTIAYIGKHYERIRAWRFFDDSPHEEERFNTFSQIVVVAIKRSQPLLRVPDEVKAILKGWQWSAITCHPRGLLHSSDPTCSRRPICSQPCASQECTCLLSGRTQQVGMRARMCPIRSWPMQAPRISSAAL